MKSKPLISIISVNYNGKKLIPPFLSAIQAIKYPKQKYEVIIVDNGSSDGSDRLIENKYGWVKLIRSKKNLGFGGGNNLGIENAKGDFLFLVNNDTVVDSDCLSGFSECFNRWNQKGKVGALSAKLLLMDKYLRIILQDAQLHDYGYDTDQNYGVNKTPYIIKMDRGKNYKEVIYIPLNYQIDGKLGLSLIVNNSGDLCGKVRIGKSHFKRIDCPEGNNFKKVDLKLSDKQVKESGFDLIQNAGSFVFRDGYGRDRGAVVFEGKQYYEEDKGQYDKEEKISAFCGAGVFINKKAIDEVGGFDDSFFMYYEDDDMSFRFKEAGWDIVYCPSARIRHVHAASSSEWSPNFIYNVERSRLLFVSKHWPRPMVIWQWLVYFFKDTIAVPMGHLFFMEFREFLGKLRLRLRVNLSVMPYIIRELAKPSRLSHKEIKDLY